LVLRRGPRERAEKAKRSEAGEQEEEEGEEPGPRWGRLDLVELQDERPWNMVKIMVPIREDLAKWWSDEENVSIVAARIDHRITGQPQVRLHIEGGSPPPVGEAEVQGYYAVVDLPEGAVVQAVNFGWIKVTAAVTPLAELGPIRALVVTCPMQTPPGMNIGAVGGKRHPLRWLLLPWFLLLLPFAAGSTVGPMALLAGACLMLASIACLSFVIAVLIVLVQRRCVLWTRRWRRLWRLRALARRSSRISAAYGDAGPCCICLAEADEREKLIALLPCRHALHEECYSSWVGADAYPSHDLICPLCRRRADAIGKLGP